MKALIVDDSMINLKVMKKTLEKICFDEVDIVLSGKECIEIVKSNDYDVIFMDIMMPEMDGIETLDELKKDESFKTPVITLTADVIEGAKEKYTELGFSDYIPKPIDIDLLKDILSDLNIKLND